jgi:ataxin-3
MRAEQEYAQRELAENSEDVAVFETRRRERQREEDEDAEQLRRAIEESEAMARAEGHVRGRDDDDDDDDDDGDYDDDYMDVEEPQTQTTRPNLHPAMATNRVYDDDDAELQAALKASLEHVPEGWELPDPIRTPIPPSAPPPRRVDNQNTIHRELDKEETESVLSDDTTTSVADNMSPDASEEAVSVDEMRKRRLARFGA